MTSGKCLYHGEKATDGSGAEGLHPRREYISGMIGPEQTHHLHTERREWHREVTPPKLGSAYFYPGNAGGAALDHTPQAGLHWMPLLGRRGLVVCDAAAGLAPPPAPSATEACSAPAPPSAPLPPLPVRSGGQSRQGRLRDVSVRGRSWGQAWVLGVPVGAAGQVGQAGKLGGRTVGLRSPGHRGGLQGCDEGTASCNRELQSYPPPPA